MEILLEAPVIKSFEGGGIIKIFVMGIGGIGMLAKDTQLQGIGPPVGVAAGTLVRKMDTREKGRNYTECLLQQHCFSCVQPDIHS